jgi:hypothetical protein
MLDSMREQAMKWNASYNMPVIPAGIFRDGTASVRGGESTFHRTPISR